MKLNFKYESYQDVRSNLSGYTALLLLIIGAAWFYLILPEAHRTAVLNFFDKINLESGYLSLIKGVSYISIVLLLAYILIEILKIHDHFYDRHITKWRYYYAIDFIIPRLVYPFANHLTKRFYIDSTDHVLAYQNALFYHFVSDRDTKIRKNTLLRFYEKVTNYWITQVNEIFIIITIMLIVGYSFYDASNTEYYRQLLIMLVLTIAAFMINRLITLRTLKGVRSLTEEEIFEIHDNHKSELESRLQQLCHDLNLGYN